MNKIVRALAALILMLVANGICAATPSEFYRNLLRRGVADFNAGRFDAAEEALRIAAFGLVDTVDGYQTAHVYLALASDRLGRTEEARRSIDRVHAAQRVEARYATLPLPAEVRSAFDTLAQRVAPAVATLLRTPGGTATAPATTAATTVPAPQVQPPPATTTAPSTTSPTAPRGTTATTAPATTTPPATTTTTPATTTTTTPRATTPAPQTTTPAPTTPRATTPAPQTTTPAPQTTAPPATTTTAPTTTTPRATTPAPQTTTPPATTTTAPTTTTPRATTPAPQTTAPPATTTPAPTTTTPRATTPAPQTTAPPATTTTAPTTTTPRATTPAPQTTTPQTTTPPATTTPRTTTPAPQTSTTTPPPRVIEREIPAEEIPIETSPRSTSSTSISRGTTTTPAAPPRTTAPTTTTTTTRRSLAEAERALAANDLITARAIFRDHLGGSPDRATLLRIAEGLYRARDFANALVALRRMGQLRQSELPYRYYIAVALYETGQYAEAKRELLAALPHIELTPDVERYRAKILGAID